MTFKVLAAKAAAALDKELMSSGGFSIDQLMELAGLSVAQAVYKSYPPSTHAKVLVLAGPGNNGGDGLVAARHLKLLGYTPRIYYPKKTKGDLFKGLMTQLDSFQVDFIPEDHCGSLTHMQSELEETDQIIDALFGFSFHPPVRSPFDVIVKLLAQTKTPISSVDIPSGWDVDNGPMGNTDETIVPSVLISLTAPKPCAKLFKGTHYLGGRFISKEVAEKWGFEVPKYEGLEQVAKL